MSVVIAQYGYAETDYATEPYAAEVWAQADGVQWQQRIDRNVPAALQWRQRIDFDAARAFEWHQRIDSEAAEGFEFRASPSWTMYQCGPGYLSEEPYLSTFPYLAGAICGTGGLQFEGSNFDAREVGVQFRGLNDDGFRAAGIQQRIDFDKATGVQFRGLNEGGLRTSGFEFRASRSWTMYGCGPGYLAEEPYLALYPYLTGFVCATGGVQFRARNDVQRNVGVQWRQRIDRERIVGLQWLQRVTVDRAKGFQFTAIKQTARGFQFRVVIYNTTNIRILSEFPSRGSDGQTWTASTTAASSTNAFQANNLNTDIVEQVWRSSGGGNAELTCDTQVTQGIFLDTLAILNHDFGGNTTVQLQRSTNGVTWSLEANLVVEPENMYYIAPSLPLQAYRYWRIAISDGTKTSFQVGTILFGSSIIFQGECFVDRVRFGKKQFADRVFTEGHTNVANDRGKKRYLGLEFRDLQFGRNNFQQLRDLFDSAGTLLKCLYIPTPSEVSRFAVFGKLTEIPEEEHNYKGADADYVSLKIDVDESL
jgi:hypothetical protein